MLTAQAPALLQDLQKALSSLEQDHSLHLRAAEANPWFTPALIGHALAALHRLCDPELGARLRAQYPQPSRRLRVGIIMAGNVPLVGLQDLVAVLLAGHEAVVKCSSRDALLLPALLAQCAPETQSGIQLVTEVRRDEIDFLIATGSDSTALHIAHAYAGLPQVVRHNRFSIARVSGGESAADLAALAQDILLYHGMGCRNVSSLLVPRGWDSSPLVAALDHFDRGCLSTAWWQVVGWEKAEAQMRGESLVPSRSMAIRREQDLRPARVGCLHLVQVADESEALALAAKVADKLQCCVGLGSQPRWGTTQSPSLADFPDGIDLLERLTA